MPSAHDSYGPIKLDYREYEARLGDLKLPGAQHAVLLLPIILPDSRSRRHHNSVATADSRDANEAACYN